MLNWTVVDPRAALLVAVAVAGLLPLSALRSSAAAQHGLSAIQLLPQNTAPGIISESYPQDVTRSSPVAAPSTVPLVGSGEAPAGSLRLALWGGAGMLTGLALGAYIGNEIACNPGCAGEDPGLREATLGAGIGMTVVTPLAVHLANSRRGNLAASLAASALLAGFWFLGSALEPSQGLATGLLIVGPPIAQIATSVWIERSTSERGEGEEF